MATRPHKGRFRTTCPRCPLNRIHDTRIQGKRVYRIHSCERQHALAEREARVIAAREREGVKRDCQCKRANHEHGTRTAYIVDKCRCRNCTEASRLDQAKRERAKLYGRYDSGRVDAEPARQHVHQLMAAGIGLKRITALTGISTGTLGKLLYGIPSKNHPPRTRINTETADKLLNLKPEPTALADGALVPATGTQRRIQALVCLGYSISHIGSRLGWTSANFHGVLHRDHVTAKTAAEVRELFEELWDKPYEAESRPERVAASRARNHAAAHGWLPPMAWDDDLIDDPDHQPVLATPKGGKRGANEDLFLEEVDFLRRTGASREEIAKRMGNTWDTIERRLRRYGRPDLVGTIRTADAA